MMAHLHPVLALVPIVPFLPGPRRDTGMFASEDEVSAEAGGRQATSERGTSAPVPAGDQYSLGCGHSLH